MTLEEAKEANRKLLNEVRAKHPERATASGALLAELRIDNDLEYKARLVFLFWLNKFRRGRRQFERMIESLLLSPVEFCSPERKLLGELFIAIAKMDTPDSHALLVRVLGESKEAVVRADVLEAMAWEEKQFEVDLVLPFTNPEAHFSELISALYALEFHSYACDHLEKAQEVGAPLLKHSYSMVKTSAMSMLSHNPTNRELLRTLADDPDKLVQQELTSAMRTMDMYEEWTADL